MRSQLSRRRGVRGAAPVLIIAASALAVSSAASASSAAEGVELRGMGGMGINFWFMDVDLTGRHHQRMGVGVTGRVHLEVGRLFRVQVGLVQGRFTEDDESQVKRNLIYGALEAVYHSSRSVYVTAGVRMGGDHIDLIETLTSFEGDSRLVRDEDRWLFLWEPFLTIGLCVGDKYHFELETGAAFSHIDSRVSVSYVVTLGIFFRMGSRSR